MNDQDRRKASNSFFVRHRRLLVSSGLASVLLLTVGFLFFPAVGHDDSHITYWPAYTLANHGDVLNYNGDRVEQSSSLLQVLLLAVMGLVTGLDMAFLGPLSGILAGVAALFLLYPLAERMKPGSGTISLLLTVTSAYFIYWTFGGLETSLVVFTITAVLASFGGYLAREESKFFHLLLPAFCAFLYLLARPESPFVLICLLVGALLAVSVKMLLPGHLDRETRRRLLSRLALLLVLSTILAGVIMGLRYLHFGSPFPQPVTAKASGALFEKVPEGLAYIKAHLLKDPFLVIFTLSLLTGFGFGVYKLFRDKVLDAFRLLALVFLAVYWCFIITAGGDWMEGGRFFAHTLPVAAIFIAVFLKQEFCSRKLLFIVLPLFFVLQGTIIFNLAAKESTGMPLWSSMRLGQPWPGDDGADAGAEAVPFFERYNRVHMRDFPAAFHLGNIVQKVLDIKKDRAPVTLMSGQMGMVAYYTAKRFFGKVRFYDRHALVERTFTDCKITARRPKYTMGLLLSYNFFFARLKGLKKRCGILKPDIIFDLKLKDARKIERFGYTTVYIQEGRLLSTCGLLPGFGISANQFVALRNDLARELELGHSGVTVQFPQSRLARLSRMPRKPHNEPGARGARRAAPFSGAY